MSLSGKVAVVTGGGQGIGLAIAHALAADRATVILNGRDASRLDAAVAAIAMAGGAAVAIAADVSRSEDVDRLAREAIGRCGKVDILVNNAGACPAGGLEDLGEEEWAQALGTKLLGYVRCTRAFLPAMKTRGDGRVVNIIGTASRQPRASYLSGSCVNAALLAFTKAVAQDAAPAGVLVNAVNPGPVATERWLELTANRAIVEATTTEKVRAGVTSSVPLGRVGRADEIAAVARFLCSNAASYLSGAIIDADGGANRGL